MHRAAKSSRWSRRPNHVQEDRRALTFVGEEQLNVFDLQDAIRKLQSCDGRVLDWVPAALFDSLLLGQLDQDRPLRAGTLSEGGGFEILGLQSGFGYEAGTDIVGFEEAGGRAVAATVALTEIGIDA